MMLTIEFRISSQLLTGYGAPLRSLYVRCTLLHYTFWLQRWARAGQRRGIRDWRADASWACGVRRRAC